MNAPQTEALARRLAALPDVILRRDAPLAELCWFRIGGPAALVAEPASLPGAARLFAALGEAGVRPLVIGDGSNLLFDDAGYDGVVLRIGRALSRIAVDGAEMRVDCGAWTPRVALAAQRAGLSGIEHVIGIPGAFGGLVAMNGGSRRESVGTHLLEVEHVGPDGEIRVVPHDACGFSYRASAFQARDGAILRARLRLVPGDRDAIRAEMRGIMAARRAKFPLKLPNCGSVFLSTRELFETIGPPGRAIEEAGLRGRARGAARIAPIHGNFIVNEGGARAADVLGLIALARGAVRARTGIAMDAEVRFVHADGRIEPAHLEAERRFPREAAGEDRG
ncbi:MAG: UDP-N-acetylmuramate dehydrogenase [Pseudomonadota bacterium]|nr:UDP-N-acetylmuramate dehydrogenase [Pseudomonadota bacterium]